MKLKTISLMLFVLATACGTLPQLVVTPAAPISPTAAPISSPTLVPATSSTINVPTSAPAPSSSTVLVDVSADNVMLRSNPGKLFPAIRTLTNKETLTAFGRAPGDDWLFVRTSDNQAGWVSVLFVTIAPMEMDLLAEIKPTDVQIIHGIVMDVNQGPISGVGFALTQGQTRDDATTASGGDFYFYLPQSAAGIWQLGYVSLACTSNAMSANCKCSTTPCGQPNPSSMLVNLPLQGTLNFVWR